jgi:hypothetical protein
MVIEVSIGLRVGETKESVNQVKKTPHLNGSVQRSAL